MVTRSVDADVDLDTSQFIELCQDADEHVLDCDRLHSGDKLIAADKYTQTPRSED